MLYQFITEYGNQFITEYGNQFITEYGNQFTTEYGNQFITEYGNQLATEYGNQLATEYGNQLATGKNNGKTPFHPFSVESVQLFSYSLFIIFLEALNCRNAQFIVLYHHFYLLSAMILDFLL